MGERESESDDGSHRDLLVEWTVLDMGDFHLCADAFTAVKRMPLGQLYLISSPQSIRRAAIPE